MSLPDPGAILGDKYLLDEVIGEGGFARVYKATDTTVGRSVALKILRPEAAVQDPTVASRFTREARALAGLIDEHTIRLFEFGRTDDGLMYMAFELLAGIDLEELLRRGTLSEPMVVDLVRQLLTSLREAHHAGILHRDIKPSNIRVLWDADGRPRLKLMDFGIALPSLEAGPALTQEGRVIGTPRYMSPEQSVGAELTPASDLFSVGLVAVEILTGDPRAPLEGLYRDGLLRVPAGPRVQAVLARMLARLSDHRFQSAEEVLAALAVAERSDQSGARYVDPSHSGTRHADPSQSGVAERSGAFEAPPRTGRWILFGGALVGGVAAVVAAVALREPRAVAPAPAVRGVAPAIVASQERPEVEPRQAPADDVGAPASDHGASGEGGCGTVAAEVALRGSGFQARLPQPYDPKRRHPVLMLFYGSDGSPRDVIEDGGLDRLADAESLILVSPLSEMEWSFSGEEDTGAFLQILEDVAAEACIDRGRVFVVGHGTGGKMADKLACVDWVTGVASTSWRPRDPVSECGVVKPRIIYSPSQSRHLPLEGGNQCLGVPSPALGEYESMLQARNRCTGKARKLSMGGKQSCRTWSCEAPFVSCVVDGGHNWPGMVPRRFDILKCDGEPPKFDYPAALWSFFDTLPPI